MRKVLPLLLLLAFTPLMAFGEAFYGQAVSPGGSPLSGAIVKVCSGWSDIVSASPSEPCDYHLSLATIYRNGAMTGTLQNPFNTDQSGHYGFFAPSGEYTITIEEAGYRPYSYEVGGATSGLAVETNGLSNASQSSLNFTNPSSFNGLTFTYSNPTSGNETFALGGTLNNAGLTNSAVTLGTTSVPLGGTISSATGFNSATASAFDHTPTGCSSGQFSTGIAANGNSSCSTPTGGGNVTGPSSSTVGDIALFNNTSGTLLSDAGKGVPSGNIVGTTDAQTLTNKTLTSPTINGGALSGTITGSPTLSGNPTLSGTVTLSGSVTGSVLQGTDSKLLTAGTISGTGATLCTDSVGGATTSGCTSGSSSPVTVAKADLLTKTASISDTTIYTPSAAGFYRVTIELYAVDAGSGTVTANVTWTQSGVGFTKSSVVSIGPSAGSAAGSGTVSVYCDASTAITYSITYSPGTAPYHFDAHIRVEEVE